MRRYRIEWLQESERIVGKPSAVTRAAETVEAPTLQAALDAWGRRCYINSDVVAVSLVEGKEAEA